MPPGVALVVMGASGDLAHRKLFPALGSLAARGQLPAHFALVGVARTEFDERMSAAMDNYPDCT